MKSQKVVYMVTYKDSRSRTHITFVESFSAVKLLEERFDDVYFEVTHQYPRVDDPIDSYEQYEAYFQLILN